MAQIAHPPLKIGQRRFVTSNLTVSPSIRFRKARVRAGLSTEDAAARLEISGEAIARIESVPDELCVCFTAEQTRRFCKALETSPREFFGVDPDLPPLSGEELAARIRQECRLRDSTIEELETAAGCRFAHLLDDPSRMTREMTIEGLQCLCRELRLDWHRILVAV